MQQDGWTAVKQAGEKMTEYEREYQLTEKAQVSSAVRVLAEQSY